MKEEAGENFSVEEDGSEDWLILAMDEHARFHCKKYTQTMR